MDTTPVSLLERLRRPEEQEAWTRFVKLYTPLLYFWAKRMGLQQSDAADLVQDVFTLLVQKLPQFRYDNAGSFRNWLLTVMTNKLRDRARRRVPDTLGTSVLAQLPAPEEPDCLSETEYRERLVREALRLMQSEFSPSMWKACWEHAVMGRPAAEVAAELGIAVGSVYVARSRVLTRLRLELKDLFD
jgi:RNA polymerase sigma-70 factor (ECF subfamily)